MLRIGLTGGIGAGKSTVSATFSECGGIIVDGDVIAREVVEPGTEGLAKLVDAFGEDILLPDGALNRPALAAMAFSRRREARRRSTASCTRWSAQAPRGDHRGGCRGCRDRRGHPAAGGIADGADVPAGGRSCTPTRRLRVQRLIEHRGFSEADARARIAAQATEEQRRAVADVLAGQLGQRQTNWSSGARDLWHDRILPFAHNICRPGAGARRHRGWCRPIRPGPIRRAGSWQPAEHRVRAPGDAHRPHRVDGGARPGRQGRHRHPGHRRIAGRGRRTRRRIAGRGLSARGITDAPNRRPQHVAEFDHATIRRCGTSGFTRRRIRAGRPTCTSGSTAGPISSSRCCSSTG